MSRLSVQPTKLCEQLLELGRDERFPEIACLPGAGIQQDVCHVTGVHRATIVQFFDTLSQHDRSAFVKAIALYEHTVGGLGSVTTLEVLLPMLGDAQDDVFDWILRNTISYDYYAHGARSLDEYRDICSRRARRRAEAMRVEMERQAQAKMRIAACATSLLYNAVRRGDVKAVRALLAKGADPNAKAPDGISLEGLAIGKDRRDIADELRDHRTWSAQVTLSSGMVDPENGRGKP